MNIKSMLIYGLRQWQVKAAIRRVAETRSQLERFNEIWADAQENVPFYAEWAEKHHLPRQISDLSELAAWPILHKRDLMQNREKLTRKGVTRFHESVTGGSTGEPLHFRTMGGESDEVAVSKWIGWARLGLYPDSRCFLLWGHRNFHGQGFMSNIHFAVRRFKDWLTNNSRADATNLSLEALTKVYAKMRRMNPDGIIAYAASLLALVRAVRKDHAGAAAPLSALKAVVCTAGPLSKSEREEIASFFKVPVAMEYGSMEAGVMAYQTPSTGGRYAVFDTHLVHAVPDAATGQQKVLATKLYKCYLPLIRYDLGDYVTNVVTDEKGLVRQFDEVFGRSGDEVDMGDGIRFHGQSFMACAESYDKITAYQIRIDRKTKRIVFAVMVRERLTPTEKDEIINLSSKLSGVSVAAISLEEVESLVKAPSGKIRLVVDETR